MHMAVAPGRLGLNKNIPEMGDMMSGMQEALEGRDWEWNGSKQITRMHEILKYICVCVRV